MLGSEDSRGINFKEEICPKLCLINIKYVWINGYFSAQSTASNTFKRRRSVGANSPQPMYQAKSATRRLAVREGGGLLSRVMWAVINRSYFSYLTSFSRFSSDITNNRWRRLVPLSILASQPLLKLDFTRNHSLILLAWLILNFSFSRDWDYQATALPELRP